MIACRLFGCLRLAAMLVAVASSTAAWGDDCAAPVTQRAMQKCAYDEFLVAQADYAGRYQALSRSLAPDARAKLLRMQQAWMRYRSAACEYESSAVAGNSAQPLVQYRCLARMTRSRVDELAAMPNCREGDIACVRR